MAADIQSRRVFLMGNRVRHVPTLFVLLGALAVAAVFVPAGGASSKATAAPASSAHAQAAAPPALPTLYVNYTMNCTFTIVDDNHQPVTSIAPGTYQVMVTTPIMFKLVDSEGNAPNDWTGCKGWAQFQLTGPGVNMFTSLDTGCDAFYLIPAAQFKPSSTYTAVDLNQPSVTKFSLTTTATGTPTQPKTTPYDVTSGKGDTQQSLLNSQQQSKTPPRGTLAGMLSANGQLISLKLKGKNVSTLKAGRYRFTILDMDPKGSFNLKALDATVQKSLTTAGFVGKHTVTLTLAAGQWSYFTGLGKTYSFRVTS
jgi:hypothetical protein